MGRRLTREGEKSNNWCCRVLSGCFGCCEVLTCARSCCSSTSVRSASDRSVTCGAGNSSARVRGLGTATAHMPAAWAAARPLGVSSKTTQSAGATPSRVAASRNRSGAGFTRATSSRVHTAPHQGAKAVARQPGPDPLEAAARGDGRRQPQRRRLLQPVEHAGPQRLVLAPPPVLVAHPRHPHRRATTPAPGLPQQLGIGVEPVVRAQRVPPLVHRQLAPVVPVDLGPDVEDGRLAVDDQPVEVEDHGAKRHFSIVPAAAGPAQHPKHLTAPEST